MRLSLKSIFPARDLGWNHVRAACGQPDCHNKLLTRLVPGSRLGIFVGDQWYCSADCFAFASRGTIASLSAAESVEVPRNPRLSLGLALLTKGFISTEQFRQVTANSPFVGADIEAAVSELGWVTEKQLAAARAIQWVIRYLARISPVIILLSICPQRFFAHARLHRSITLARTKDWYSVSSNVSITVCCNRLSGSQAAERSRASLRQANRPASWSSFPVLHDTKRSWWILRAQSRRWRGPWAAAPFKWPRPKRNSQDVARSSGPGSREARVPWMFFLTSRMRKPQPRRSIRQSLRSMPE